uniref:ABC-2 type transporter transmembrane domain-containing protein n=1 Tax=Anopheles minimus TaxID=112268 RepID=A0A182VZ54_9DIPT
MNDAVVGTLDTGSILTGGDSPEDSPLSPTGTGGSGSESSNSPSAPSSISSSTSGSSASTCEASSPPAVTAQPAQVLYMPVGLANIKEELPEPEIQADSELSLEEGHALVQVLEDTPNDEAPPPEPEVEIRAGKADKSFRKLTSDGYSAKAAVVRVQMGKVTYQLTDQMLKSSALAAMHNPLLLTKDQLERMIAEKDPELEYRKHHNNNSTWQRYMPMYYKGIKQNYVRCLECGWLVLHKASTGTGSLLRHRCKIKVAGVEVKLEPKVSSSWNTSQGKPASIAKSAAAIAGKVQPPATPPSTTSVTTPPQMVKYGGGTALPQNVKDELVRQQACVLYKDIVSADLFDQPSFRTLAQMLVNIGAFYGQQPEGLLASRDALLETVLPAMYHEAKGQLNKVLSDCDLTFSFSQFRHEHERRSYVAINAYTVASDYYFRPLHVKTLDVTGQEVAYVEHLQRIIEDSLARSFSDPIKLVYGGPPDAEDCTATEKNLRNQREQYELIPCAVTMLWNIMKHMLEMFQCDSGRYLERFLQSSSSEDEDETLLPELAILQRFLEPFREPIRGLTSDTGVTISEVALWRKKLELNFRPEPEDEEEVRLLKEALLSQLRTHFPLHDYHRIAVFLDPKFKGLRFLTDDERDETLAKVKQHLHADLDGIDRVKRGQYGTHGVRKRRSSLPPSELRFYEFMDASLKLECDDVVDDEIQQYVDVKLESAVDIMSYWRNETAFPLLKRLCRRILNIPAACDEMRQLFGQTGQRDLQKRRLALSDRELDMVMYLHQNVSSPSRDRFLESSQQIEALVERFARETPIPEAPINPIGSGKIPLAYGKPGELKVWGILYLRLLAATFSCGYAGMKALFLRLLAMPATMGLLWIFYGQTGDDAHGFFSKGGLILSVLALSYGVGIWATITLFPPWRKRFCQEYAEGLYTGATMLIAYNTVSIPFSFISSAVAACVLYPLVLDPSNPDGMTFTYLLVALWTSFMLAEQLCVMFLLVMKSQLNAAIATSYILIICLTLASGSIRSTKGLPGWLQENAKGVHTKYASSLLHTATFLGRKMNCTPANGIVCPQPADFLMERLGRANPQETTDIAASIAFALGLCAFNMILYLLPMPRFVRRKFRE